MSSAPHTVHVRVNDAATGRPTPVRIRFTDADGRYYAPLGRLAEFPTGWAQDVGGNVMLGETKFTYIDGTCEIPLPAGPVRVEICKGPEYQVVRQDVRLGPGQLSLRLTVERWADLRRQGWYSGDTQAHFLTPHAALLEAAAEDLAVVNLLAREYEVVDDAAHAEDVPPPRGVRRRLSNILAFSGQRPCLETPDHVVVVNTLNEHMDLGRVALLNCHRPVYPLWFGRPSRPDDWSVSAWCDQCHRKGGLVVGVNAFAANAGREILAGVILDKVDALQLSDHFVGAPEDPLHDLLGVLLFNCGYRVALAGGSGKVSNRDLLGGTRTYARIGPEEAFTYQAWIEAVRAGRTFVTTGPLLSFQVNGQEPGAVVELPDDVASVHVRAEARGEENLEHLEVVRNGKVVASARASGSPLTAVVDAEVAVPDGGWLSACCGGPYSFSRLSQSAALTSPVWVRRPGPTPRADPAAAARLIAELERMLTWVHTEARCGSDAQRRHLAEVFEHAREDLRRRLG